MPGAVAETAYPAGEGPGPEKEGFAVLVKVERAEDLLGKPLTLQ